MALSKPWMTPVWELAKMIPAGRVMTYGSIASLLPGVSARMVGAAMAHCPDDEEIPWWRVINSRGAISPRPSGHQHLQKKMLQEEGVRFKENGTIKLQDYIFRPGDNPG